ncbi:leukotriene B4 receptor 1 [Ornithorhynchus anatinus]|uniref:Leukotriene B4 receptor n=1 Tax=Ornithorhynchus anatinus TaxID=9258 RepID=F6PR91_ORNAN|nr:leukotriene B4 receptor 1 [Ornithorhynchus anatinus]
MNASTPASPSASVPLAIGVLALALGLGLPGNAFVVWSILARLRRRSVTALLVLHLALADLAVLLTGPFFLDFLTRLHWSFGLSGCILCHYVCGLCMYASVLLIAAMSVDRSLAVARPFLSQKLRTKKAARWVLAVIWASAALLATPVVAYRKLGPLMGNGTRLACKLVHPRLSHVAFHLLFESITGFLLPFLAVVASYSDVGRRLRATRFRRSRRTGRLVVLIVVTFALFWLPYHSVNLAEASRALGGLGPREGPVGLRLSKAREVLIALAFLSSSVNPLLYACAGGGLLRSAGVGFVAKLLEGTGSEGSSARRVTTLKSGPREGNRGPEPGPAESLTVSTNPID